MLKQLTVKNFAIIEDLSVDFSEGMTVLTGETGAGKSLIIDTIELLLGARADTDMIRYGASSAYIKGEFTHISILDELFNKNNIPVLDTITVEREISNSGKIKVNGKMVTLVLLKQITSHLANIHVQNDTYRLFNPENYISYIDDVNDDKLNRLLTNYSLMLYDYNNKYKEYTLVKNAKKEALENLDLLQFERSDLEALSLTPDCDKELEERIAILANFDKIFSNITEAYNILNSDYTLDSLYNAGKSISSIEEYDEKYKDYSSKLMDAYYILGDIKDDLAKDINSLDYDEDELNTLIERNNDINKAKDKYHKNVNELIDYLKEIIIKIEVATNYDDVLKEKEDSLIKSFNDLKNSAIKLTEYRQKKAQSLTKAIIKECKELDLENTQFIVQFNDVDYTDPFNKLIFKDNGVDEVNFMISFNKGEPLKPLHKVASGGEMSRIMLAFKSVLAKSQFVSVMIFDEIDTGVSGSTAKKIANKMAEIAKNVQVLCITHLPQVAAKGDEHKFIYKVLNNDRTHTQIKNLSLNERVEEIARMISGDSVSVYALENARELINNK